VGIASVVGFLATVPEVPGSITHQISLVAVGLERVHSALVRINEELFERKVVAPV
jgi:hypothetical protein